jgi:hypothetical protein
MDSKTAVLTKVKSRSPNHRFVIAWPSPDRGFETGLPQMRWRNGGLSEGGAKMKRLQFVAISLAAALAVLEWRLATHHLSTN